MCSITLLLHVQVHVTRQKCGGWHALYGAPISGILSSILLSCDIKFSVLIGLEQAV